MIRADLPIVVVGGGVGGLSAAICLAAARRPVILLEQQPVLGGKMGEFMAQGFRWDTGPSVITMRPVFESLFACAGRRLEDYLDLVPIDPLTRYFFPDGSIVNLTRDWPSLAAQIATLHPQDVAGYLDFLAYAAELYRITGPVFIHNKPPSLGRFVRVPLRDMAKVAAWSTMHQTIARRVHHPHLRQILGRFATYVGASPYSAPATLSVIAHVELTGGVWYPRGGVYAVAKALRRLAEELGVEIRTSTQVEAIEVTKGHVTGVHVGGATIATQSVIANVDVTTVYRKLLSSTAVPSRVIARLESAPTSCSGFALLLGIRGCHADLAHHNIFFSADYPREFDDIFVRRIPPQEPTIYVAITSKTEPDHAPPGAENWFVLVNVPALDDRTDWHSMAEPYRDHVLATLAQRGCDIRCHIVAQQILTPLDIARATGAWRGALYGLSSNEPLNAFRRPHNRSPHVKGLYFAGGAVHPGGGVPMVIRSGMTAADLLLADSILPHPSLT